MGIEIPDYLKPVASIVGCHWPPCDEDALYTMGGHWENMAGTLGKIKDGGDETARSLLSTIDGQTSDAFRDHWTKESKQLDELVELCNGLGKACKVMSVLIKAYKLYTIAMMIDLAVELAIAAAAAVETLGASMAEAAGKEVITREILQKAAKKLLMKILEETAVAALKGFGEGAAKELAWQGAEDALGLNNGIDWKKVGEAGVHQGISNAVSAEGKKALKEVGIDEHHHTPHAKGPHEKDDHEKSDHEKDDDKGVKEDHEKDDESEKDGGKDKDDKEKEKEKEEKAKEKFDKKLDKLGDGIADQAVTGPDDDKKRLFKDVTTLLDHSNQTNQQNPSPDNPQQPARQSSLNLP